MMRRIFVLGSLLIALAAGPVGATAVDLDRAELKYRDYIPGPVTFSACHGGRGKIPETTFALVYAPKGDEMMLVQMDVGRPIWIWSEFLDEKGRANGHMAAGFWFLDEYGAKVIERLRPMRRHRIPLWSYAQMRKIAMRTRC